MPLPPQSDELPSTGAGFTQHPEYDRLDDGLKEIIGAKQFAWMPDAERARFLRSAVEAEGFADS